MKDIRVVDVASALAWFDSRDIHLTVEQITKLAVDAGKPFFLGPCRVRTFLLVDSLDELHAGLLDGRLCLISQPAVIERLTLRRARDLCGLASRRAQSDGAKTAIADFDQFITRRRSIPVTRVYFAADATDAIKVGYSTNVDRRMRELATGSYRPLELIGHIPGDTALEIIIHTRLSEYRLSGEWFRASPYVRDYAQAIVSAIGSCRASSAAYSA